MPRSLKDLRDFLGNLGHVGMKEAKGNFRYLRKFRAQFRDQGLVVEGLWGFW